MKCACGGPRAWHMGGACSCDSCRALPEADRCHEFQAAAPTPKEAALAKASENSAPVGREHPDTSHEAAALILPNTGTMKRSIYELIVASGERGMTSDEAQRAMNGTHQTFSARVSELAKDGLIVDSCIRRRTRSGDRAVVYIPAPLDGSPYQPQFDFTSQDDTEIEDEADPEFDARLLVLSNGVAGRTKSDAWAVMKWLRPLLLGSGYDVGDAPIKAEGERAAA